MNKTINDIDDLIGKFLAGEASSAERTLLDNWVKERAENRQYFEQLRTIFDQAARVKDVQSFDTDAAWSRVKSRLGSKTTKVVPMRQSATTTFLRIAASLLLISVIGYFAYFWSQSGESNTQQIVSDKRTQNDTLPDGTNVFLNKQTRIAYRFDKKKKEHRVSLQGEAYFNIHHEDNKTFIVDVGEAFIKDIGTSFNVKSYPDQQTVEVVVEEGEVMFYTEKDSGVYLKAGGKGVYNKVTKTFSVEEATPNVTAYKTKFFSFSDQDLASVVANLNAVYDEQIVVPDALKNCRVTVSFNDESIEEIATILAETLGVKVSRKGNQFQLEGVSCE